VAKNEELAKNRAAAVRDALKAAGVAEANVEMKPPMFVEIGAAGGDAEARRVEINKQ
jgi:outer membrane protein OmpA-like peptidoglycan-associated protein